MHAYTRTEMCVPMMQPNLCPLVFLKSLYYCKSYRLRLMPFANLLALCVLEVYKIKKCDICLKFQGALETSLKSPPFPILSVPHSHPHLSFQGASFRRVFA